jgi:hypothetical protein
LTTKKQSAREKKKKQSSREESVGHVSEENDDTIETLDGEASEEVMVLSDTDSYERVALCSSDGGGMDVESKRSISNTPKETHARGRPHKEGGETNNNNNGTSESPIVIKKKQEGANLGRMPKKKGTTKNIAAAQIDLPFDEKDVRVERAELEPQRIEREVLVPYVPPVRHFLALVEVENDKFQLKLDAQSVEDLKKEVGKILKLGEKNRSGDDVEILAEGSKPAASDDGNFEICFYDKDFGEWVDIANIGVLLGEKIIIRVLFAK